MDSIRFPLKSFCTAAVSIQKIFIIHSWSTHARHSEALKADSQCAHQISSNLKDQCSLKVQLSFNFEKNSQKHSRSFRKQTTAQNKSEMIWDFILGGSKYQIIFFCVRDIREKCIRTSLQAQRLAVWRLHAYGFYSAPESPVSISTLPNEMADVINIALIQYACC